MNLYRYNHYNVTTGKITDGQPEIAAYVLATTIPTDYTLTNSVQEVHNKSELAGADYLQKKLLLLTIHDGAAWSTFTDTEKDIFGLMNIASGANIVPFYMGHYSLSQPDAEGFHGLRMFESIELNSSACHDRFMNKAHGWFPIMFAHFAQSEGQSIIDAIRDYISDYTKYAKFGTLYGDSEQGLLDFINNTGSVVTSLEDYTLLSGTDYTAVQTALTSYFYE